MVNKKDKKTIVAVSGGFDPLHKGHVQLFKEAKKLGDELVVILNNDNWLEEKKGYGFMPEEERAYIIEALEVVDRVFITEHPKNPKDMSVADALRKVKPAIFGNGGDRKEHNTPESDVCEEIGCKMVYNLGDKVQSSSWLLEDFFHKRKGKEEK
ncbi:MAG: adenylyltransferase/cytidyltransferase family protein [Candidatus Spechtbacterales bacterium]